MERWIGKTTNGGDATRGVEVPSYGHLDRLDVLFEGQALDVLQAGGLGPILSIHDGETVIVEVVLDYGEELGLGLGGGSHEQDLGGPVDDELVHGSCEGLVVGYLTQYGFRSAEVHKGKADNGRDASGFTDGAYHLLLSTAHC